MKKLFKCNCIISIMGYLYDEVKVSKDGSYKIKIIVLDE